MTFDFRIRSEENVQKIFQSLLRGNMDQMIPVSPSNGWKNFLVIYYGSDPKIESHISKDFEQKFLKIFRIYQKYYQNNSISTELEN